MHYIKLQMQNINARSKSMLYFFYFLFFKKTTSFHLYDTSLTTKQQIKMHHYY